MADREKVISELQAEIYSAAYHGNSFKDCVPVSLLQNALSLLKAQEPIPCGEKIKAGDIVLDFYECGYCKNAIRKPWRYCPFCGNEVKWDGFNRKTLV